jgi:hypothetical protein
MTTKTLLKAKQSPKLAKKPDGSKDASNANEVHKPIKNSFYEKSKHLAGSVDSGLGDLSSNKDYLKGFGRNRNADNH